MGRKEDAVTIPKRDAEPVSLKRYRGSANLNIALPNIEMICPITTSVKFLLNSFVCSIL